MWVGELQSSEELKLNGDLKIIVLYVEKISLKKVKVSLCSYKCSPAVSEGEVQD